ncbi:MAG: hypothetical protein KGS72_11560 [Cyanobacteria bacterium REEB67]|nr:hypothetical protein [Cyanobacteria bacterium REEB67]
MSSTSLPAFVREELQRGESIVWQGQPDSKFAFRVSLPVLLIALVIALVLRHHVSLEFGSVFDFVGFFFGLLQFIPVAVFGMVPLFLARMAANTYYVLTNERVLIMRTGRNRVVQAYVRSSLTPMFKLDFAGRSMLCWRAPGMSQDRNGRLTANTVVFYAVDPTTPAKMGIEFPKISDAKNLTSGP